MTQRKPLKRSPMPPRKEWMKGSSLRSSKPSATGETQPKQRRSTGKAVGKSATQRAVRRRSGGECEVRSPWHLGKATNLSHRRHQGQGGEWSPVNILDSCGHGNATGCHGYIHQHPEEAREKGWIVSAFGADPAAVEVFMWHDERLDWWLLLPDGTAELAPFPKGDPRHPDDIEVRADRGLDGVA